MSFVTLATGNAYYELSGRADAPVVLFANSLGTSVHVWDAQMHALAPAYRVLRYDMRGHGLSEAGVLADVSIATLAADVAALLAALEIPSVRFVGLSIGGMIGQCFAATYPALVEKLVLCATGNRIGTPATWDARIAAVERGGMHAIVPGVLERWFTPHARATRPALIRGFATMLERTPAPSYLAACRAIREADLREADAAVRCPTLVIAGADDAVTTPASARDLCAAVPRARLHVVDASAHILCAEAPAAFNEVLLSFLAEPAPAAQAT